MADPFWDAPADEAILLSRLLHMPLLGEAAISVAACATPSPSVSFRNVSFRMLDGDVTLTDQQNKPVVEVKTPEQEAAAARAVQRQHRRLNSILRIAANQWNKEWDQCLDQAAFSYNITPLTDFPYSPYYMLHLFHPRLPADMKCLFASESSSATVKSTLTIGEGSAWMEPAYMSP